MRLFVNTWKLLFTTSSPELLFTCIHNVTESIFSALGRILTETSILCCFWAQPYITLFECARITRSWIFLVFNLFIWTWFFHGLINHFVILHHNESLFTRLHVNFFKSIFFSKKFDAHLDATIWKISCMDCYCCLQLCTLSNFYLYASCTICSVSFCIRWCWLILDYVIFPS